MRTPFSDRLASGRMLLGVTNNQFIMELDGHSNFMGGLTPKPDTETVLNEIEKALDAARAGGFGDVAILWPMRYRLERETGLSSATGRIVERIPLPLERLADICGRRGIFFWLIYCETLTPQTVVRLRRLSRGHFLGECLGEVGGRTWYSAERVRTLQRQAQQQGLTRYRWQARDLRQAVRHYVDYIRRRTDRYRPMCCPISTTADSTALQKYNAAGGVDLPCVEISHDFGRSAALARGAARSYAKPAWAAYIPLGYYWGWPHDTPAKIQRWKTGLYLSYMAGAAMVINENGVFGTQINKPGPIRKGVLSANSRFCRAARKVFEDFARFRDLQRRPAGQPRAAIGIVQGHLDGWNNIPQEGQGVWGQHDGDQWRWGAAESAWRYLDVFLPGGRWLSGTPHGQVDVVSSAAPTAVLREYRLLILLGWHTMTCSFLAKLKAFVAAGGTVFLTAAHLDRRADRSRPPTPVGEALQRELFGLVLQPKTHPIKAIRVLETANLPGLRRRYAWKGAPQPAVAAALRDAEPMAFAGTKPVLTRKTIGSGSMYLLLSSGYPGARGWEPFLRDTLQGLAAQALRSEDVTVQGSPTLNWAFYPKSAARPSTLYLLEYDARTDEYPACNKPYKLSLRGVRGRIPRNVCGIKVAGHRFELNLAVNALRVVSLCGSLALSPDDSRVALVRHRHREGRHRLTFRGDGSAELTLVALNGGGLTIETPGVTARRGTGKKRRNWVCRIAVRPGTETELVCFVPGAAARKSARERPPRTDRGHA